MPDHLRRVEDGFMIVLMLSFFALILWYATLSLGLITITVILPVVVIVSSYVAGYVLEVLTRG
jgi:hypothetical protein